MTKLHQLILFIGLGLTIPAQAITVAEALAIGNGLAVKAMTDDSYTIEGYVNVIDENAFNETYNNMSFWLADTRGSRSSNTAGALYVYRGRPDVELQEGDRVSVTAKIYRYGGTLIETSPSGCPITLLEREDNSQGGSEGDSQGATSGGSSDEIERDGSLRVCAQNLRNYYYNYQTEYTSRPDYTTAEGFAAKTRKIVNAMLSIDADIYAFCEVEAKSIVLQQLADSMNTRAGTAGRYAAVNDNINYTLGDGYDNHLKSGFIYRTDRVATYGTNNSASTANYYCNTMRYQTFRQLSNDGKLVVSMNHFKAKDSSADAGEATRISNATNLINKLSGVTTDPDILILGDLNCSYEEEPVVHIVNAGYEEQLLRFDANAYSHCYGDGELIDHVLANSSMANQITNAYVKHICTYHCSDNVSYAESYSDHDPYIVEIMLNEASIVPETAVELVSAPQYRAQKTLVNGQLIITLPDGRQFSVMGAPLH